MSLNRALQVSKTLSSIPIWNFLLAEGHLTPGTIALALIKSVQATSHDSFMGKPNSLSNRGLIYEILPLSVSDVWQTELSEILEIQSWVLSVDNKSPELRILCMTQRHNQISNILDRPVWLEVVSKCRWFCRPSMECVADRNHARHPPVVVFL